MDTDVDRLRRRKVLRGLVASSLAFCFSRPSHGARASPKESHMSRIFITGSTDGLGLAAARDLMAQGHQVVLHARSPQRASALTDLAPRSAGVVIGDLSSAAETRAVGEQVNRIGRMDAVNHNAGIYQVPTRGKTPEGHATVLAVNTPAPYMLTALIERPQRLVYMSSGMHRGGGPSLRDTDWVERRWGAGRAGAGGGRGGAARAGAGARRGPGGRS